MNRLKVVALYPLEMNGVVIRIPVREPSMLERLIRCQPLLRPGDELLDQVFGLLGDLRPLVIIKHKGTILNILDDFCVGVSVEWRIPTEHDIQDASG